MMRFSEMLNRETIKSRDVGEPLARLGRYFGQYWYMIALAVLFVVVSTWTQVTTPELTGQATDCFLVPAGASAFGGFGSQADSQTQASASTCYLTTDDPSTLSFTRQIVYKAYTLGGFETPNPAEMTVDQRIEGLTRLILVMI